MMMNRLSEFPLAAATSLNITHLYLDGMHSACQLPFAMQDHVFEDPATLRRFHSQNLFRKVDGIALNEIDVSGKGMGRWWVSYETLRKAKTMGEIMLEKI